MSAATTSSLKSLAMAGFTCSFTLPSLFTNSSKPPCHLIPPRPVKLRLSSSTSSRVVSHRPRTHFPSFMTFVAQTSDWAQQEEDNSTITIDGQQSGIKAEEDESTREDKGSDGVEASFSDWDGEGEDAAFEASGIEAEGGETTWEDQESDGAEASFSDWEGEREDAAREGSGIVGESDEEFPEPSEEAKLFVGNLPYDVDSQGLAMLFEKAGTVEIAEVIYNRVTDRSRGFGFVTMSTVEEAEKAVELLNGHDMNGRLLTVNKAAPRGSQVDRPHRAYEPKFKVYVGNIPWDVDDGRLEQIFSEHGKVVEARVVYDRETGRSRGFGFVTMSSETELNDAIAALDGQSVDGRTLRVSVADERPRRSF